MHSLRSWTLTALVASIPSLTASAQRAVSFEQAVVEVEASASVRATARALEVRRRADAEITDVTSPARVYLMPGIRAVPESNRGFEGQIQIGQTWNLMGLGGARRDAARAEREAIDAEVRTLIFERRVGAAEAWLRLRAVESRLALSERELELSLSFERQTARAAVLGVMTRADLEEASAFRAEVALEVLRVEGERVLASAELARLLGHGADLRTAGEMPEPLVPVDTAAIAADRIESLPAIDWLSARIAAARAQTHEADVAQGLEFHTDLFAYRESPNALLLFAQVGVDIPLTDLNARARSLALEAEARAEGELESRRIEYQQEARLYVHEVHHSRREESVLREQLVPALERLVRSREAMLAAGTATILVLLDARRRALAARARLLDAEAARVWAEYRASVWLGGLERGGEAR